MFGFKTPEENEKKPRHWPLYLVAVFFILADLIAASYLIFEQYHKNRIYPGVSIGQVDLGGKTVSEAKKILDDKINHLNQNGLQFTFNGNTATITPIISSFSGELARQLIIFNADDSLSQAFAVGREKNPYTSGREQLFTALNGRRIDLDFEADNKEITKMLADSFEKLEEPPRNAELVATTTPKKEIVFKILEEKIGFNAGYSEAVEKMTKQLLNADFSPINIAIVKGSPDIKKSECKDLEAKAKQFIDKAELTLSLEDQKWPIEKKIIAGWLTLKRGTDNKIVIDLDEGKISKFLEEKIAPSIEIIPVNARFQIKDNRVVEFIKAREGRKIDPENTIAVLRKDFLTDQKKSVEIATINVPSEAETNGINNLGITEIIGTGHSNFAGSPKNRIHNIGTGAAALNGLLVAPGAEFSVDTSLGEVTAKTGYLPEMTIKGDKTVPEYGGGLCQIGTTMFRAALAAGFPITARQPHSYRVVYYEPAGTDAAIYQPWPDLRFVNDSPNYVLIQTHASGSDLYFDLWGTKDGRVIEQTDPTVYNIVKPQPTKIVETLDLPPGQKKCTERAHSGADAFFDYKVTYPDGTIKEKRFSSHYVPWREVCLLGVAKLSTTTPATVPAK